MTISHLEEYPNRKMINDQNWMWLEVIYLEQFEEKEESKFICIVKGLKDCKIVNFFFLNCVSLPFGHNSQVIFALKGVSIR